MATIHYTCREHRAVRRATILICLLAALSAWIVTTPVEARRGDRSTHREATRNEGISLDEAVARVRNDTGGRVLSAQPRNRGTQYRIKVLLPNGTVRVFNVDARSGAMH